MKAFTKALSAALVASGAVVTAQALGGIVPCAVKNVDYYGHDVDKFFEGTQTKCAENCQKACQNNDYCHYFTYITDRRECYLKDANATRDPKHHPTAVSGPKYCPAPGAPQRPPQQHPSRPVYVPKPMPPHHHHPPAPCPPKPTPPVVPLPPVVQVPPAPVPPLAPLPPVTQIPPHVLVPPAVPAPPAAPVPPFATMPPHKPPFYVPPLCFKDNIDYYGFDLKKVEGVTTPLHCQQLCVQEKDCAYWTFTRNDRVCYLKGRGATQGARTDTNAISGPRVCGMVPLTCYEQDVDYYGCDIEAIEGHTVVSPDECQKLCQNKVGCKYWTYVPAQRNCYLKSESAIKNRVASPGTISGPKVCSADSGSMPPAQPAPPTGDCLEYNVEYVTGTIRTCKAPTLIACQALCQAEPLCVYLTFKPDCLECALKTSAAVNSKAYRKFTYSTSKNCVLHHPPMLDGKPVPELPQPLPPVLEGWPVPERPLPPFLDGKPVPEHPQPFPPVIDGRPVYPLPPILDGKPVPEHPHPFPPVIDGRPVYPLPPILDGKPVPEHPQPYPPVIDGRPVYPLPPTLDGKPVPELPRPFPPVIDGKPVLPPAPLPPALSCIERNTDYTGQTIGSTTCHTVETCQRVCQLTAGCRFFSFVEHHRLCILKSDKGEARRCPGVISGPQCCAPAAPTPSPDVCYHYAVIIGDSLGSDVAHSAPVCQNLCMQKPGCAYFTYSLNSGECVYFKNIHHHVPSPFSISGLRVCIGAPIDPDWGFPGPYPKPPSCPPPSLPRPPHVHPKPPTCPQRPCPHPKPPAPPKPCPPFPYPKPPHFPPHFPDQPEPPQPPAPGPVPPRPQPPTVGCVTSDVQITGVTVQGMETTFAQCRDACLQKEECQAFNYTPEVQYCSLVKAISGILPYEGTLAVLKNCLQADLSYESRELLAHRAHSFEDCSSVCFRNGCEAFNYIGSSNHCSLATGTHSARANRGSIASMNQCPLSVGQTFIPEGHTGFRADTSDFCRRECYKDPNCHAFTFKAGLCTKMHGIKGVTADNSGAVSGLKHCCASAGMEFTGLTRFGKGLQSLEQCRLACVQEPDCVAFNYNGHAGQCFLLSEIYGVKENKLIINGHKRCCVHANTHFTGATVAGLTTSSFDHCQRECMNNNECNSYTYVEHTGQCFLLSQTTGMHHNKWSISGLKSCNGTQASRIYPKPPVQRI